MQKHAERGRPRGQGPRGTAGGGSARPVALVDYAAGVDYSGWGLGSGYYVYFDSDAARPALHLSLSASSLWSKGEKVSANVGEGSGGTTPTPSPTGTPIVTPTPTGTPIVTPTPTSTTVVTPTPTSTSVVTPTPTSTPVVTPVPTSTPMVSPTATPTIVPTKAPTSTITVKKGIIISVKNKTGKKVVVKIKKVFDAKGYQLQYALNKKFKKAKTVDTKKTTITVKKLTKKKTYYFRVRAYKMNGAKKVYGKWSGVKKVKVKK